MAHHSRDRCRRGLLHSPGRPPLTSRPGAADLRVEGLRNHRLIIKQALPALSVGSVVVSVPLVKSPCGATTGSFDGTGRPLPEAHEAHRECR
jgi:hypothetical protein